MKFTPFEALSVRRFALPPDMTAAVFPNTDSHSWYFQVNNRSGGASTMSMSGDIGQSEDMSASNSLAGKVGEDEYELESRDEIALKQAPSVTFQKYAEPTSEVDIAHRGDAI